MNYTTMSLTQENLYLLSLVTDTAQLRLQCVNKTNPQYKNFAQNADYAITSVDIDGVSCVDDESCTGKISSRFAEDFAVIVPSLIDFEILKLAASATLMEKAGLFLNKEKFAVGDKIIYKPGMCLTRVPAPNQECIVLEVLETPVRGSEETDGVEFGALNDIIVGVVASCGDFIHYGVDSRRFTHA